LVLSLSVSLALTQAPACLADGGLCAAVLCQRFSWLLKNERQRSRIGEYQRQHFHRLTETWMMTIVMVSKRTRKAS
jgi:hypothetical protein